MRTHHQSGCNRILARILDMCTVDGVLATSGRGFKLGLATMQTKLNRIRDAANYAADAKREKSLARGGKASGSRRRGH
jgi:hypothetical protein